MLTFWLTTFHPICIASWLSYTIFLIRVDFFWTSQPFNFSTQLRCISTVTRLRINRCIAAFHSFISSQAHQFHSLSSFVTIQQFFLFQTQRRWGAEVSFLEFNRDLENKTPYEHFEVCHWLTCRPKLWALRALPIEWKDSLRLSVSAFFIIKVFR